MKTPRTLLIVGLIIFAIAVWAIIKHPSESTERTHEDTPPVVDEIPVSPCTDGKCA